MIRCQPKSLFSWDFYLEGDGHRASLEFKWVREEGALFADGTRYEVRKHGVTSGKWTLEHGDQEMASAQKASALTRTFRIQSPSESLVLRARSAFGSSFLVERSGDLLATIAPAHPFTRRATIDTLAREWDFPTISFSFWLAVLTWRRIASSGE